MTKGQETHLNREAPVGSKIKGNAKHSTGTTPFSSNHHPGSVWKRKKKHFSCTIRFVFLLV
jgi:hypothetical protein